MNVNGNELHFYEDMYAYDMFGRGDAPEDRTWDQLKEEARTAMKHMDLYRKILELKLDRTGPYPDREQIQDIVACLAEMNVNVNGLANSIAQYRTEHSDDWV